MYVRFVPMNGAELKHTKIQVEPTENLAAIREKVAKHFNINHFKLLFHGRLVSDNDQPMSHYKMNANSTIHIIESGPPLNEESTETPVKRPPPSEDEIQQFLIAFGLAVRNPSFHKVAQRLGQRENLENIVAACPELGKDPVACAFLSKPELLYSLLDQDTLKYVHERHPGLVEAAHQLAAAVHEEKPAAKPPGAMGGEDAEAVPAPFAYNLDEMSDEDDDAEEMETGELNRQNVRGGRRSEGGITAASLASAIANVQSELGIPASGSPAMGGMTGFTSNRPPTSAAPTSGASSSGTSFSMPSSASLLSAMANAGSRQSSAGSQSLITQNQLAQALALVTSGAFGSPQLGSNSAESSGSTPAAAAPQAQQAPNFDSQLARMREMGIADERMATRALNIMGGDVQAAIELIFSGWNGEDDSAA